MKETIQKIKSILLGLKEKNSPFGTRGKIKAQSMVEFAVTLPLLVLLLLGIVEYGFILNTYLSLLDATRGTARIYSNQTPFTLQTDVNGVVTKVDDLNYYPLVANSVVQTLDSNSYKIKYDNSVGSPDNILVSVISADWDTSTNPDTFTITRHPTGLQYYSLNLVNGQPSRYASDTTVKNLFSAPVDAGLLIVEVYYGYEGTMKVPSFFSVVFPTDAHPFVLYASTIMPLISAKPAPPTPTP